MIPVAACFKFWEQHCESVPGYKSTFYLKLKGLLLIIRQIKAAISNMQGIVAIFGQEDGLERAGNNVFFKVKI